LPPMDVRRPRSAPGGLCNHAAVTDETSSKPGPYLLDNRESEAGQRFNSLAALFNPVTFGHIEKLGITDGWRYWEVGAGGPSVPEWLGSRVGPVGPRAGDRYRHLVDSGHGMRKRRAPPARRRR
jgi:hypothetical protein